MRLTPPWAGPVLRRLDDRLNINNPRPLALALSGGGDSVALLHLVAGWARARGRPVLALTVDHSLNPASVGWSAFAERTARAVGADWRGLGWAGPKPSTGLPAAARAARHRLLATAAREAGARIILMAHTADDVSESAQMRAEGTPLGRLSDWSPSPAWPEGRGLMLLRPMLDVSRSDLRVWLRELGSDWIEDPANVDPRFHRARVRAAGPDKASAFPASVEPPSLDLTCDARFGLISGPLSSPWLAQAVACASGRSRLPTAAAVKAARARLGAGARQASLSGAVVSERDGVVVVTREPGRRPPGDMALDPGELAVWDGRFEVQAAGPGWTIGLAAGRRARLSPEDRARLSALPAISRGAHPVLFREDDTRPLLASPAVTVRSIVAGRLRMACGGVRREDDL